MATNCSSPESVVTGSECFLCLNPKQIEAVKTYLLAQIAGGSTDPATLLASAKCFLCLTPKQAKAIQTKLLCEISSA